MLKLIEKWEGDGGTVEIFQTHHTGDDYHVRYGLQVTGCSTLAMARKRFLEAVEHARDLG